jgi:flagellar basal body rod protein FlgG
LVDTPEGERLTRGGSWRLDAGGLLVDTLGAPVLGEDDPRGGTRGPIRVPADAASVRIAADGAVLVDGVQRAKLRLEDVPAAARLEHAGDGRFLPAPERARVADAARTIRQGALEESNVGSVPSLVDLISIQRAYSSVQKVLTTIDGARGIAVSELAKPL